MKKTALLTLVALLALARPLWAQGEGVLFENPHRQYVQSYEGTKTCLACHQKEAQEVFHSVHYQWKAPAPNILNSKGRALGKLNTLNDFCTNPSISWIAELRNDRGETIAQGCSKCHAGLGLKPSEKMTQEQLENIDCLMCHSPNYRRVLWKAPDGSLRRRPALWDNPQALLAMAQSVQRPTTAMCLRCHAGSGGGFNYKRGNLEPTHARATPELDVHMGNGMTCIQCHKFKAHKVLGSGTQLAGQDRPGESNRCENCHKGDLHKDHTLNQHTRSVYCTVCHIPSFAKDYPTDMHRDWSKKEYMAQEGKYEPLIRFQKDVRPVYAWWNGKGTLLLPEETVRKGAKRVKLYAPQGSITDPDSRIYAFKLHTARLPLDTESRRLIPIKVGLVFKKGATDAAIRKGAKAFFGRDIKGYEWIVTERYMGIFHEVAPKEKALKCLDCHMGGDRLHWKALGYKGDPIKYGGRF